MIAFYACTNTQIINMINVKEQYYQNVDADLYILKKNRIDLDLIQCIKDTKVFKSIIFIEPYITSKCFIKKYLALFITHMPNKYYDEILIKKSSNIFYDKFLTFGFWSEALYILDYFYRQNTKIEVEFVEEGLVNYFPYRKKLYYCRAYYGLKEKIIRLLAHGLNAFFLKKNINSVYYLYMPEYFPKSEIQYKKITAIDIKNNYIFSQIFNKYYTYKKKLLQIYQNKTFIYIFDNKDIEKHIELIKIFYKKYNINGNFLIKLHPENTFNDIKKIKAEIKDVQIDDSNFYFESLGFYYNIENINLICRGSSIAYNMHMLFGFKYKTILTYKLFAYNNYVDVINGYDKFWNFIYNLYKDYKIINDTRME